MRRPFVLFHNLRARILVIGLAAAAMPLLAPAQQVERRTAEDQLTARAISLALTGNWFELHPLYEDVNFMERAEGIFPTRKLRERHFLQDNIFDLYTAAVAPNRVEMLKALDFIKDFPYRDANSRFFLAMARNKITPMSMNRVERRIFLSRFASVFNRLGSGISQLAGGQTIVLLQLPVDAVYSLWRIRVANPMERQLLWMKQAYVHQGQFVDNEMKYIKEIRDLETKVRRAFWLQDLERGKMALRAGDLMIADFYFSRAAERMPTDNKAPDLRDSVRRDLREQERRREDANAIMGYRDASDAADDNIRADLAQLLAAGQWEESTDLARQWASDDPEHASLDDIELVDAVTAYALGYRQRARVYFLWIAGRYAREMNGQYARAILKSEWHFPDLAIGRARARFRADTRRFIFLGHQTEDYAYVTATQAAALQPAWIRDVAFLFIVDSMVRGVFAAVNNPVSRDGIIDAARMAHLRLGRDEDPGPVLSTLLKNYAKAGRFDQAVLYATLENQSPKKVQALKNKEVKSLYRSVLQVRDVELRLHLLNRMQEEYPGSVYEAKIQKSIDDLTEKSAIYGQMDRKTFAGYLSIFNQTVFQFDPAIVDGKKNNGEISSKGVTLRRDKTFEYYETYLKQSKLIPLNDNDYRKATEFFDMHSRIVRVDKARESREISEKAYLEIRGGIGASGADLYPGVAPAVASEETRALFE